LQNGSEAVKTNNRGKSTFFPDDWDEIRILNEVEFAIQNNHGCDLTSRNPNEYFGYSKDGKVEIHSHLSKTTNTKKRGWGTKN
jgi:hypothetical protein